MFRQGDVLIRRVSAIPKTAKNQKRDGRIVLAYGEVTGHAHAIHDEDTQVFVTPEGGLYLSVTKNGATVRHEEHSAIALPPGQYERTIQREYEPAGIRQVLD